MPFLQSCGKHLVRLLGPQSAATRSLRPLYAAMLEQIGRRRGIPWSINGISVRIDPGFRWQMAADYDRPVAEYLAARVKPGHVCMDVGANVGVYVLQFAAWSAPSGHIVAFEPNRRSAAVLRRHVQLNRLQDRVTIVESAVSNETGSKIFYASETDGMSRLGSPNPQLNSRSLTSEQVTTTTLDDYCGAREVLPDWIVIDIEGYEFAALAGAREIIRRRGNSLKLIVELHPASWADAGTSASEAEALLRELRLRMEPLAGQSNPLKQHGIVALVPE